MTQFRTDAIFDALKSLLAVVDNPERRAQLEGYVDAARLPLEGAIFELLSRFTEEVKREVASHYDISLNYRPGALDLEVRAREAGEPDEDAWPMAEGEIEKITLRIPAELKELATEAAARAGLSVNAWFVRVLARALRASEGPEPPEPPPPPRGRGHGRHGPGQRLSGWVGPDE